MHVGLIVPSFGAGEREIPALSLLVTGLAGQIDITVIPLRNPAGTASDGQAAYDVLDPAGADQPFRALLRSSLDALRAQQRARPFDLLHGYWLFEPGFVAALAARLLHIPAVVSIGGAELVALPEIGYGGMRSARGRLLHRAVLGAATSVTGGSRYVLDLARETLPGGAGKLRLAPLPVQADSESQSELPESPVDAGGSMKLLQVGAYLPVKGQDLSIRALATLAPVWPDLTLTLIGEDPYGYRRRMAELARFLGIADRVRLLGRTPHAELAGYYQHSDLLLMPSRHESQGMVVLEAAAHGLPTVGSDVGVVRDLSPAAAVSFTVGDLAGMTRAITALVEDPDRRRLIGAAARREVRTRYAVEPVMERWLEVYGEALHGG